MSIETIEQLTKAHAADRALLAERMQAYQALVERIKRRKLPGIKLAVASVLASHAKLKESIDAERALFAKPKTRILHGIKVGLQKGRGKLNFAVKPAQLIKLIRKHLEDKADLLIKKKEEPAKDALLLLTAEELKKIGCTIVGTGDEIVIKPADSAIDKLVDALLNGDAKDQQDEDESA